jgi:hypothetical protein
MKTQPPSEADWRRRHALNMAGQLPENVTDALVILELLRELVVTFLHGDMPGARQGARSNAQSPRLERMNETVRRR